MRNKLERRLKAWFASLVFLTGLAVMPMEVQAVGENSQMVTLDLSEQNMTDLSILETMDLSNVHTLDLSFNRLTSLETPDSIGETESVERMEVGWNNLTSLRGIEKFPNLKILNIGANRLTDLTPLSLLKIPDKLTTLYASGNEMKDLAGAEILTGLETLSVGDNCLTDIKEISVLKNLKYLYAENNQIERLDGLDGLEKLASVELNENNLTNLEGLGNLPNLTQISLADNNISDLEGIQGLKNLRELAINGNEALADITPLLKLEHLESVRLDKTAVSDEDILRLAGFHDTEMNVGDSVRLNRIFISMDAEKQLEIDSLDPEGVLKIEENPGMGRVYVTVAAQKAGRCSLKISLGEQMTQINVVVQGIKGDLDGDMKVDISDLRMVLRAVCGKIELAEKQVYTADADENGTIDIADLRLILRFVCGKVEFL